MYGYEHPSPQYKRHQRGSIGRRMVELQHVGRDGQMSWLSSRYPNNGDNPQTGSTLPLRMHPGHGNSSHAHPTTMFAPLIYMDLSDVITRHMSTRTSGASKTYQRL